MLVSRKNMVKFGTNLTRFASSRRKGRGGVESRESVIIPEAPQIAQPWNERKGVWKSTFEYFEPKTSFFGPDFITLMQTPLDFSPKNVKKWYDRRTEGKEVHNQRFIEERLNVLGPDLAAAHFVVHRGGRVRFVNENEWISKDDNGGYLLPDQFVQGLFVDSIEIRGFELRHSGLENILDLPRLRSLSFAGQTLVDDWTMDSVSGSYGETLHYLDISHCPRISHRALACFYRFQKLDTLVVEGISQSSEFKLSCMMLEELKPHLTIKGIDYIVKDANRGNEGSDGQTEK